MDQALARATEAYAAVDAKAYVEDGEATVRLAYAEALLASGHRADAVFVLADAMAWLQSRAQTLDDFNLRTSFLERIPEHRRIRELAANLGFDTTPEQNTGT